MDKLFIAIIIILIITNIITLNAYHHIKRKFHAADRLIQGLLNGHFIMQEILNENKSEDEDND